MRPNLIGRGGIPKTKCLLYSRVRNLRRLIIDIPILSQFRRNINRGAFERILIEDHLTSLAISNSEIVLKKSNSERVLGT